MLAQDDVSVSTLTDFIKPIYSNTEKPVVVKEEEVRKDAELDPSLVPEQSLYEGEVCNYKCEHVFLTGATGIEGI